MGIGGKITPVTSCDLIKASVVLSVSFFVDPLSYLYMPALLVLHFHIFDLDNLSAL